MGGIYWARDLDRASVHAEYDIEEIDS